MRGGSATGGRGRCRCAPGALAGGWPEGPWPWSSAQEWECAMDVTDIIRRQDNLPHWQRPGGIYFLRTSTLRETAGALTLRADVTEAVVSSLCHDDGRRYCMHCWVIMPDHLHMLLQPVRRGDGFVPVGEIMQALKGASAHRINPLLGRTGPFWLDEYFDHEVRSDREYGDLKHYILRSILSANGWAEAVVVSRTEGPLRAPQAREVTPAQPWLRRGQVPCTSPAGLSWEFAVRTPSRPAVVP